MRARNACMASERPNTIASGGISPIACTRELTEFVVVIALELGTCPVLPIRVHPVLQTCRLHLPSEIRERRSFVLNGLSGTWREMATLVGRSLILRKPSKSVGKNFHTAEP